MKRVKEFIGKVNKSEDLREFSINSFWSLLGSAISKGLLFVSWLMVAKILGKEGNGEVGIVRSTINVFVIFVGSGIALTTTKFIPELLEKNKERVGKIISLTLTVSTLIGFILSLLLFAGSSFIANNILNAPDLLVTLQISSFLLFLSALSSLLSGCLRGFKDFKSLMVVNFFYGISLLCFLYYGTIKYGVEGTFAGFTISTLILVLLGIFYLRKNLAKNEIALSFKFKGEYPILRHFTLPAILTGIMVMPFKWGLDTIMVNHQNGFKELGLFTALILFQNLVMMITTTLDAPLITIMVKEKINKKIERLNLIIPWAIGVLMVLPIFFFPNIYGILLGEEYMEDVNYKGTLFIILATTTIMLYKQGIARIMIVNNLMWLSFLSNLIWGLLLLSVFYFTKIKNAESMAFAYFIAYVVNTVIIIPLYVKRKIIPLSLIKSRLSILIWIIFSILVVSLYQLDVSNVEIRILGLITSLGVFASLFYKLLLTD
ncbi:oligosaccharide flippase family protein [Arenibacter aquaticus]|uniref:oligosaccharide flippase family protein n=1 Tax=Arenibacter aquaticus TaxID=2489054 RepID=UPI001304D15F|nr:oligosaccharide flippase family protein [Arenibacter aquaticus]